MPNKHVKRQQESATRIFSYNSTLIVTVTDINGNPIPNAEVEPIPDNNSDLYPKKSDTKKNGETDPFQLNINDEETYTVYARHSVYRTGHEETTIREGDGAVLTIRLVHK